MEDIRSILSQFPEKQGIKEKDDLAAASEPIRPTLSEIPDIFFDDVLLKYRLSRPEIMVLMFLYRQVWCWPNLYREHGIGPINSYIDIARRLNLTSDEVIQTIKALEQSEFIQTVRAGQYFVRRYFTKEWDETFEQKYEF